MNSYPPTMSVADAGRVFFGLGRNASYDAAARGDIPTIRIGQRKLVVPTARMLDLLGMDPGLVRVDVA